MVNLYPAVKVNRRFIVQEGASNRRKREDRSGTVTSHAWGSSNNGDAAIHVLLGDEAARMSRRPLQVRKWGDELLPQIIVESGESKPKLVYPAVAPEMPPEMRAMIEGN